MNKVEHFNIEHNNRNLVRLDTSYSEDSSEDSSSTDKESLDEKLSDF